jgi:hypothetical protein
MKKVIKLKESDLNKVIMKVLTEQEEDNGTGGPTTQGGEQVSPDQYPPEDNTSERGDEDSKTPQLDADIEKYSNINKA